MVIVSASSFKQLHGTIEEHLKTLTKLNKKGAGIYFTVNETNLKGRTTEHIKRVRAVFIDLDGYPLPKKFELQPHMIVETSPKKYHCYWLCNDVPLVSFSLFWTVLVRFWTILVCGIAWLSGMPCSSRSNNRMCAQSDDVR